MNRPSWRLPPGVSRGTWDYLQSEPIATEYDDYFADHPLLRLDIGFVRKRFEKLLERADSDSPPVIADFGCGTGRVARALGPLGFRLVNIDLSCSMLGELARWQESTNQSSDRHRSAAAQTLNLRSNLAELDCLQDACLDGAVCLFSSLGMIRGRQNRIRFLSAACRALKEGGELILHAHNRYRSLHDPVGRAWLLRSWMNGLLRSDWEFGDKVAAYRGLPQMFLHIYGRRELKRELKAAGFTRLAFFPIDVTGTRLTSSRSFQWLNAGGYFVTATNSDR